MRITEKRLRSVIRSVIAESDGDRAQRRIPTSLMKMMKNYHMEPKSAAQSLQGVLKFIKDVDAEAFEEMCRELGRLTGDPEHSRKICNKLSDLYANRPVHPSQR